MNRDTNASVPRVDAGDVRRRWIGRLVTPVLFLLAIAAGIVVTPLLFGLLRPHAWHGTRFPDASAAPPLTGLTFDDGSAADLAVFEGDVVLIYFGYTFCPDVCPTTLQMAARAIESIGDDGARVHLLMVSVDPARDPLDQLGNYVRGFDPTFRGVGGPESALADAAALYGIYYAAQEPDANGFYLVDHTATLIGIDTEGRLVMLWNLDITAGYLADDLEALL